VKERYPALREPRRQVAAGTARGLPI